MILCQNCGREAPTKYVEFYQNIGALVMRFHKSVKGNLCKNCINEHFWPFTGITLLLGWWGVISFIVTPFMLLNNIGRYVAALGLEAPDLGARPPTLNESAVLAIRPFAEEIIDRIGAEEPIVDVASSVAPRAGVTQGQVVLFIAALAEAAKKR